ncbi:hypothetical protein DFH09DRAFT_1330482 [Mycena vulgaris]|nr:hypothetical protein DFH09DRAFT_1330482 [Mycena vulgaris]
MDPRSRQSRLESLDLASSSFSARKRLASRLIAHPKPQAIVNSPLNHRRPSQASLASLPRLPSPHFHSFKVQNSAAEHSRRNSSLQPRLRRCASQSILFAFYTIFFASSTFFVAICTQVLIPLCVICPSPEWNSIRLTYLRGSPRFFPLKRLIKFNGAEAKQMHFRVNAPGRHRAASAGARFSL